jgi:hypothetical protein
VGSSPTALTIDIKALFDIVPILGEHRKTVHTACIAVVICAALYVAVRLTLRYYFPPDT